MNFAPPRRFLKISKVGSNIFFVILTFGFQDISLGHIITKRIAKIQVLYQNNIVTYESNSISFKISVLKVSLR